MTYAHWVYPNRHTSNGRVRTSLADTLSGRGQHLVVLNTVADPMAATSMQVRTAAFVVASELAVDPVGAGALEGAFRQRLGEVEHNPGFQRLEVWRDHKTDGAYLMVTWWDDEQAFRSYMRSQAHKTSHARIPTDPAKARGVGVRRFTLVAT
jgi:heme-degrading monooxygenase HmoA